MFNRLYACYKADWDNEMMMTRAGMTYAEAYRKSQQQEEWF